MFSIKLLLLFFLIATQALLLILLMSKKTINKFGIMENFRQLIYLIFAM